jgi:folylpolyglutamate synthase/dihydropteroate synthase
VVITRAAVKRAADPLLIRGYVRGKRTEITDDTKEALGLALSQAGKNDLILATGSFFVIGEIRKMILRN